MVAGARRRQAPVDGELRLVRQDGRFLLASGDAVIDVTRVVASVNYPMGQVTLALRVSPGERLTLPEAERETANAAPAGVTA
jgi:hypothetical protein